jgi:hypothetical protein
VIKRNKILSKGLRTPVEELKLSRENFNCSLIRKITAMEFIIIQKQNSIIKSN